jgi:hypothetical protein
MNMNPLIDQSVTKGMLSCLACPAVSDPGGVAAVLDQTSHQECNRQAAHSTVIVIAGVRYYNQRVYLQNSKINQKQMKRQHACVE